MSRKPNDKTEQSSGAEKPGRKASTFTKGQTRKRRLSGGPIEEETPITVSNGSIQVRSVFDRTDKDGKKHKHCKVGDASGKKWVLDRVEVYDDDGIHTYPIIGGEAAFVMVWFKRPL
jgi:phosphate-selective porin